MRTRLVLLAVVLVACVACEDDTITPPPPQAGYLDLTERSHVLSNFEVAHNNRRLNKYEELLDDDFTFHFYSGDVGGDVPAQWDRVEEMNAIQNLFDPNYVDTDPSDGTWPAVTKVFMDVKWEDGLQWQEIPQGAESWYTTTVYSNFRVDMGANFHLLNNPGSKLQFVVRNAGTDVAPHWQLVEMHDLDQDLKARTSAGTESSTWGQVKAIYAPPPSPYEDLSQREHVLANLETAYNRRELEPYEEVLDADFTFFLSDGDVGGDIPALWQRTEEVTVHTNLFNPSYVDNDPSNGTTPACTNIAMDVMWEDGLQWYEIQVGAAEYWYTTTVFYTFQFDVGANDHFVSSPGSNAQFTVRNAGTSEAPRWQLVEMRDLGALSLARTAAATEQSTWGKVKAIYR